jgi:hypothetical protein
MNAKIIFLLFLFFSYNSNAICSLGIVNCVAHPELTLADFDRLYLGNGNVNFIAHTDENSCIAAGQNLRNYCRVEVPTVVTFSRLSGIISQTLLQRFQDPAEFGAVPIVKANPPVKSESLGGCTFKNLPGQPVALINGETRTAYPYKSAPINKACPRQIRVCSNGVLSGSYAYSSCDNGF